MFPPRPVSPPPPACVTPALLDWQCSHLRFSCCSNICAAEDPARSPGSPLLGASSLVQGQDDVILKVGVVGAVCVRQTNRFNLKKQNKQQKKGDLQKPCKPGMNDGAPKMKAAVMLKSSAILQHVELGKKKSWFVGVSVYFSSIPG